MIQNIALVRRNIRRRQQKHAIFLVQRVVELLRYRIQSIPWILAKQNDRRFRPAESAWIFARNDADRHSRLQANLFQSLKWRCPYGQVNERWGWGWGRRGVCSLRYSACGPRCKQAKYRQ